MLDLTVDFEADITFLTTSEGGRRPPVMSGYRPNHDFGIPNMLNDAQHDYIDKDRVFPGDTVKARLSLFSPDFQIGRLYVGMTFTVQEGPRVVGNGTISKVCNTTLQKED